MRDINSLLGFQPKTPQVSQVVVAGSPGGYGSVGTAVRKFSTVIESIGGSIVYHPSSLNGDSFEITQSGIYYVAYWDFKATTMQMQITKNQTDLTAVGVSNAGATLLSHVDAPAGAVAQASAIAWLPQKTILRAISAGGADGVTTNDVGFRVCLIMAT